MRILFIYGNWVLSYMRSTTAARLLALVFFTVLSVSCRHIPLMEPHSGVYIKFNVKVQPDVVDYNPEDYPFPGIVRGAMPQTFRVCFYDAETHDLLTEDYLGNEGGFVDINPGLYDIMVYSMGTELTRVTGVSSRAAAYAYTSGPGMNLTMTRGNEDGDIIRINYPVIYEPDHLYVGRAERVEIPVVSEDSRVIVIPFDVRTLLESYTFEAVNIVGAERIQSASCYVTGQAPQRYLWDERHPGNVSAIVFDAPVDVENGCIRTAFNTFGRYPYSTSAVFVNLYITDKGGNKYQWIFDVTEQFDNPDNERKSIIIYNAIVVPEHPEGGFSPNVNDWNTEIIDVPLN